MQSQQVDALTKYDRRLYWAALKRFACGLATYETHTGKSLTHLLPPGGWESLYDLADMSIVGENKLDKKSNGQEDADLKVDDVVPPKGNFFPALEATA